MKIKALRALLACLCAALLCACSGGETKTETEVPASELSAAVIDAAGLGDSMAAQDRDYVEGYMQLDLSGVEDFDVEINAFGANIDEFGVFRCADEQSAEKLEESIDAYLELRLETWMEAYMPEEKPKLTGAETHRAGRYAIYCILSESASRSAISTFDSALEG